MELRCVDIGEVSESSFVGIECVENPRESGVLVTSKEGVFVLDTANAKNSQSWSSGDRGTTFSGRTISDSAGQFWGILKGSKLCTWRSSDESLRSMHSRDFEKKILRVLRSSVVPCCVIVVCEESVHFVDTSTLQDIGRAHQCRKSHTRSRRGKRVEKELVAARVSTALSNSSVLHVLLLYTSPGEYEIEFLSFSFGDETFRLVSKSVHSGSLNVVDFCLIDPSSLLLVAKDGILYFASVELSAYSASIEIIRERRLRFGDLVSIFAAGNLFGVCSRQSSRKVLLTLWDPRSAVVVASQAFEVSSADKMEWVSCSGAIAGFVGGNVFHCQFSEASMPMSALVGKLGETATFLANDEGTNESLVVLGSPPEGVDDCLPELQRLGANRGNDLVVDCKPETWVKDALSNYRLARDDEALEELLNGRKVTHLVPSYALSQSILSICMTRGLWRSIRTLISQEAVCSRQVHFIVVRAFKEHRTDILDLVFSSTMPSEETLMFAIKTLCSEDNQLDSFPCIASFEPRVHLMSRIIGLRFDYRTMLQEMRSLVPSEVVFLLKTCATWIERHTLRDVGSVQCAPSYQSSIAWVNLIIDAHLSTLISDVGFQGILENVQSAVHFECRTWEPFELLSGALTQFNQIRKVTKDTPDYLIQHLKF